MKEGSKVKLTPTDIASEEFRQSVAKLGEVTGEVAAVSNIGVCTVIVCSDVNIPGHTHPLNSDSNYLDIHQDHLTVIE